MTKKPLPNWDDLTRWEQMNELDKEKYLGVWVETKNITDEDESRCERLTELMHTVFQPWKTFRAFIKHFETEHGCPKHSTRPINDDFDFFRFHCPTRTGSIRMKHFPVRDVLPELDAFAGTRYRAKLYDDLKPRWDTECRGFVKYSRRQEEEYEREEREERIELGEHPEGEDW